MRHITDRLNLDAVKAAAILFFSLSVSLYGCNKSNARVAGPNENLILGRKWKCYAFSQNNIADASVILQQPTFEFRNDSRLYFTQINPISKDTFQYEFLNDQNIKVTKPWISSVLILNISISRIDTAHFDFTITTNENTDIDKYKTLKQ